ncbi:helix-turn-helix domain-containing protein [Bacteroidota bacterium]
MLAKYTEIILYIACFELLFLGFLILLIKRRKSHFIILALFLISKGLCIGSAILNNFYHDLLPTAPYLYLTGSYLAFTFGPLLYLFIRSMTSGETKFYSKDYFHFVPLLLAIGYFTVTYFVKPLDVQLIQLTTRGIFPTRAFYFIYWGAFYIITTMYLIASWKKIYVYNNKILNHISSLKKIRVKWLYPLLIAMFVILLIDSANMYIGGFRQFFYQYNIPVLETIFLIFAQIFIFVGLTQPIIKINFSADHDRQRYFTSKLTISEKGEILKKIRNKVGNDRLYLDPELSVEKLSKVTTISCRNISQVINEIVNQNFYEFVNYYRIEEAKKQLSDPEQKDKTVLEILYSVGYNSKSAFNFTFKKVTGLTPTQFRKESFAESMIV